MPNFQTKDDIRKMYEGLLAMKGMCEEPVETLVDVDEELYGENGAWKGTCDESGEHTLA